MAALVSRSRRVHRSLPLVRDDGQRPSDGTGWREFKQSGAEALIVVSGSLTYGLIQRTADLALANGLPSCHGFKEAVAAGGLVSLGPDLIALARQSARMVDKIIRGEHPANIPVEQPAQYVVSINLKTAKKLGLTIPPALLARADDVIE